MVDAAMSGLIHGILERMRAAAAPSPPQQNTAAAPSDEHACSADNSDTISGRRHWPWRIVLPREVQALVSGLVRRIATGPIRCIGAPPASTSDEVDDASSPKSQPPSSSSLGPREGRHSVWWPLRLSDKRRAASEAISRPTATRFDSRRAQPDTTPTKRARMEGDAEPTSQLSRGRLSDVFGPVRMLVARKRLRCPG